MRNKIKIIVCIMLVVCLVAFAAACQQKDADGLIKLKAPKNLALNGSVLSWDEVKNASEYFVSIDGKELENSVKDTTCDLSPLVEGFGDFKVSVRAYGDGKKYGTSDKSAEITYHKGNALAKSVVDIKDKKATWTNVDSALIVNYTVKVTNAKGVVIDEVTQETTEYSFDKKKDEKELYADYGVYTISVIANPATTDVEHSSSPVAVGTYINAKVLDAPTFRNLTSATISWETVTNASGYTLRVTRKDGAYEDESGKDEQGRSYKDYEITYGTSYGINQLDLAEVDEYVFTVRANGNDKEYLTGKFNEVGENYKYFIVKLASDANEMALKYDGNGLAKLSWKTPANSLATEFIISLSCPLPNGKDPLFDVTYLQKTISNKFELVKADVYDFYKYATDGEAIEKVDGQTFLVYGEDDITKVRYNGVDYDVVDKDNNQVKWSVYSKNTGASVSIICDDTDSSNLKFVNEKKNYNSQDGTLLAQKTDAEQVQITDSQGKPLYQWAAVSGESDIKVNRKVEYASDGETIEYYVFELTLDDIFIKELAEGDDAQDKYTIIDDRYYGKLYNISLTANRNESSYNYAASQVVTVDGQYMSYKEPEKNGDGKFVVKNTGEYAYIILNSYLNPNNTDEFVIENNLNFDGYELAQIENFKGIIDGSNHTVANIVMGNKVLTESGVMKNDSAETLQYSMFVNVDENAQINNVFYVGMSFIGYDKEKLGEDVKAIQVAPIAINNKGTISNVLVKTDTINAEGADVAGMVINNFGEINTASVYAKLNGRNVGGVMINNVGGAKVSYVGFYGKVTADIGSILKDGVETVSGAGFVVDNKGGIENSFSIGEIDDKDKAMVVVNATGVNGIYAGGFAATNSGSITNSYSGEFTLNNMIATVTANGNNAYAGGFVGKNTGAITSCYATNEAAAGVAGGFVGLNAGRVESSYSTGGAQDVKSENRGEFVGKSTGIITNCASYTREASDETVEGVTAVTDLGNVVEALYGEGEADMGVLDKYRNPVIKGLIYTKDNTVTKAPSETVKIQGTVVGGETDAEITVYGNDSTPQSAIVIELKSDDASAVRYIYGYNR